jgi:1-deoxy-D-xylulose-5-phosphate reductoisomerase
LKSISVLGSTGSIGSQTLEVVSQFPDKFRVVGLCAGKNVNVLRNQILRFNPQVVSVQNEKDAVALSIELRSKSIEVLWGEKGADSVAALPGANLVVSAMVGASGLKPTLAAVKSGKNIALANKEAFVMAGKILIRESRKHKVSVVPIDSEHSALFQALGTNKKEFVKRLILTASGGPFYNFPKEKLGSVSVEMALNHPTWKMGKKITIDSATLMNKGLEVIEANWLFEIPSERISVWIHPQSVVHSMVEYIDGSVIAQMSVADMKIPISYALSYPERTQMDGYENFLETFRYLTFEEVDFERFPALCLSYRAIEEGGTMPAVMNAANEIAVGAFLKMRLKFIEIIKIVKRVMEMHKTLPGDELEEILECDTWARKTAESLIK